MTRPVATVAPISGVHIGECVLDSDVDIVLAEAEALLDEDERRRAAGFIFSGDREAFIRAHGFVRRQLGSFLGLPPVATPIVGEDGQKPYVAGHEVEFSLSHSGGHAVLAIASGVEVGIDLELMGKTIALDEHFDGLVDMVLTREEQDAIAATPTDHRLQRFLAYWTAKEARMKLTGEGMSLEPQTIFLDLAEGEPVGYLRPSAPSADLQFIPLSRPDAVCCLAVRRDRGRTDPHRRAA